MDNNTKNMESSEKMIADILAGAKDAMKENLKEQIKKSITDHLTWSLREELSKIASEFVKTEMTEDIKTLLAEQKPIILEHLKGSFIKIGAQIAQAMTEAATKNMAVDSYKMKDILKKIID